MRVSCEPPTARDTNLAAVYLAFFFDFERRRANKLGLPADGWDGATGFNPLLTAAGDDDDDDAGKDVLVWEHPLHLRPK